MSMGIIKNGEYNKVAGQTQSGELVMGASTIRKGTISNITIENGAWKQVQVTFDEPMPDNNYCVTLTQNGSAATVAQVEQSYFGKGGFRINLANNEPSGGDVIVNLTWTAFKLFTVEGLEDLENDVAALKAENTVIKPYMDKVYNLSSGEPSNVAALSPTGWFNTNLKVDVKKVAVVLRHQHCIDSNGEYVGPMAAYNVSNDNSGNLIFQFVNISDFAKECTKCQVWFNLIGKPGDLPN